jgi:serine/threonine-protein phosphatase 2A regulatory subunit A
MAPALDVDSIRTSILPTVITLSTDRIPNIRFNVAKAFEVLSSSLGGQAQAGGRELVSQELLPAVEKLLSDPDADVRFFAEKAVQTARQAASGETQAVSEEVVMTDA